MLLTKWKNRSNLLSSPAFSNWVDHFFRDDDLMDNRWFGTELTVPAVNVKETDEAFMVDMAAPGMKKKDFKIEIKEGVLNISSESKTEKEEKEEDYTRKEFSYTAFNRSFWLPENVKADDIKANYADGILKIMVPKVKVAKPEPAKRVTVS